MAEDRSSRGQSGLARRSGGATTEMVDGGRRASATAVKLMHVYQHMTSARAVTELKVPKTRSD